jgi:hypothetical protein
MHFAGCEPHQLAVLCVLLVWHIVHAGCGLYCRVMPSFERFHCCISVLGVELLWIVMISDCSRQPLVIILNACVANLLGRVEQSPVYTVTGT